MSKEKNNAITLALLQRHFEAQEKFEAPYYKALGKLAISFSLVHFLIERLSWDIWHIDKRVASIITKDLPTKHLVEKLQASIEHLIPKKEDRKDFVAILKRVEKAAEKRNDLLHSLWIIKEGQPVSCFSRKRGGLVSRDAPSVSDLTELIEAIDKIVADLIKWESRKPLTGLFGFGLSQHQKRE